MGDTNGKPKGAWEKALESIVEEQIQVARDRLKYMIDNPGEFPTHSPEELFNTIFAEHIEYLEKMNQAMDKK